MEYSVRLYRLLSDEEIARKLWDALAHEMRKFGEKLKSLSDADIEKSISELYGDDVPLDSQGEKKALFIDGQIAKTLLHNPKKGGADHATYDWAGHFAHGSILALRAIARDTAGIGSDFLNVAANDGQCNDLTFRVVAMLLVFAARLADHFAMPKDYFSNLDCVIEQNTAIAFRLGFIDEREVQRIHEGLQRARA